MAKKKQPAKAAKKSTSKAKESAPKKRKVKVITPEAIIETEVDEEPKKKKPGRKPREINPEAVSENATDKEKLSQYQTEQKNGTGRFYDGVRLNAREERLKARGLDVTNAMPNNQQHPQYYGNKKRHQVRAKRQNKR